MSIDVLYDTIQEDLKRVDRCIQEELSADEPFLADLIRHAGQFHGKRLRPALLLHSARLCGEVRDVHYRLAAIVEMIHNATLVHDDILDSARLRRQVETMNTRWDTEAAVLFGDYLFARSFQMCAEIDRPDAIRLLARATHEMCAGELAQVGTKFNLDLDEEGYFDIIRRKTAVLFAAACELGTVDNPGSERHLPALREFGLHLGTAFQVVDDYLDIAGSEREMGKSLGTDIGQGKLTLPVIHLLRTIPPGEGRELRGWLCADAPAAEKKQRVWRLLTEKRLADYARARAMEIAEAAKRALAPFGDSPDAASLRLLADYILRRRN